MKVRPLPVGSEEPPNSEFTLSVPGHQHMNEGPSASLCTTTPVKPADSASGGSFSRVCVCVCLHTLIHSEFLAEAQNSSGEDSELFPDSEDFALPVR